MGLGTFPEVSLAQARKLTIEARELVAQGIDPKERRDADRQAKKAAAEHTLQNVATSWYELKKDAVTPPTPKTFGARLRCTSSPTWALHLTDFTHGQTLHDDLSASKKRSMVVNKSCVAACLESVRMAVE